MKSRLTANAALQGGCGRAFAFVRAGRAVHAATYAGATVAVKLGDPGHSLPKAQGFQNLKNLFFPTAPGGNVKKKEQQTD